MAGVEPQLPLPIPSAEEIIAAKNCHAQITGTQDGGFTFNADILIGGTKLCHVFGDGLDIYYSAPEVRTQLGWLVATGGINEPQDSVMHAPYYNALGDLKVLSDVAVAILAGHFDAIGRTQMFAMKPGYKVFLVPTDMRETAKAEQIDIAIYEASHPDHHIANCERPTSMAATLLANSNFANDYLRNFHGHANGEAIIGLYQRLVLGSRRVSDVHNGFSVLGQIRAAVSHQGQAGVCHSNDLNQL